jgi:hypothetical protein
LDYTPGSKDEVAVVYGNEIPPDSVYLEWDTLVTWIYPEARDDDLGSGFASADYNGDGVLDLVVGASFNYAMGRVSAGAAYLFFGVSREPVATTVRRYDGYWNGEHVVVAWELSDAMDEVEFDVYRRDGVGEYRRLDEVAVESDGPGRFQVEDPWVVPGHRYDYRVVIVEMGAGVAAFDVSVDVPVLPPSLGVNRPNPFHPTTEIPFTVERAGHVTLAVYDVAGRRVRTLVDRTMEPGRHSVTWNGIDDNGRMAASGVYFYRLKTGRFSATRKLVLLR